MWVSPECLKGMANQLPMPLFAIFSLTTAKQTPYQNTLNTRLKQTPFTFTINY